MREAKQKFDDLVARLKSGNDVSFGQMERVYAEGFLQSFLQRSAKQRERAIANLRRQQREFQDEDYDEEGEVEDSFSNEAIDRQELDYLRNVVETLGVKPSIEQLHQYTERAIQRGSWDMLGDVLSISQEGSLGSGTLETLAVKELGAGRIPSYRDLKKQFPQIEVSSEKINPVYTQLLSAGDLGKLKEIREEVNLSVPEEVCQTGYETLLAKKNKTSIRAMHELKEATGVRPKKTDNVKGTLRGIYDSPENDLGIAELEGLNELFGIYSDQELVVLTQRSALDAGKIDDFAHLWNKSGAKLPEEDLTNKYLVLDQSNDYESILKLTTITREAPKGKVLSRTASAVLEREGDLRAVRTLINIAEESSELSQNSVDKFSEEASSRGDAEALTELLSIGGKIKPEYVHATAVRFIDRDYSEDFDGLEQRVGKFYETFGLKPSAKVSGARVSKLINFLRRDVNRAIQEFTRDDYPKLDPLTPVRGGNLRQHNKFKSKVKKLVKDYTTRARQIKSETEGLEIANPSSVSDIYSTCLELNLAQGLVGDDKYLRLDSLVEATGIAPARDNVRTAVYNHVRRNSKQRRSNPEGLLVKVRNAGVGIEVDSEMHNNIVSDLVSNSEDVRSSTQYLKRLTGISDFSEGVYDAARNRLVRDLSNVDSSQYDALKELGADASKLNESEKERIGKGIVGKLKENPSSTMYQAEQIVRLTGIQLHADNWDLSVMVRKYFEGGSWNTEPSKIAGLLNMSLYDKGRVQNQIFDRTIKLIHEAHLEEAKKLYEDTGIHPTESGARRVLEGYNPQSQQEMTRRMNFVYGQNSGLR